MKAKLYTIGHSTRPIEEFIEILKHYGIEALVDVRTVPKSRHNPQFNKDVLGPKLESEGIEYTHASDLGGLRHPSKDSQNTGWQNDSFRGFADYMQTDKFAEAIEKLMQQAYKKPTAIMCAETLPWRCHRSLIADALLTKGFEVTEIFDKNKSQEHKLTSFAVINEDKITYPSENEQVEEIGHA